ncbi:hypothetical protein GSS87_06765 [Corynebacterium sp. 4HC-13]|uniref:hypothetical protein n=1 Tax=Corynebacterium anserum TaxID=2684406 RepID=UPI00163A2986|nr:hypothetical protein [Corynebacterium anserum]MBC2682095.1 hypothetical protein [Corynebacterium anserum]
MSRNYVQVMPGEYIEHVDGKSTIGRQTFILPRGQVVVERMAQKASCLASAVGEPSP